MSEPTGAERIAAERQRQIDIEGWTPKHDQDHHTHAEMVRAALSYGEVASEQINPHFTGDYEYATRMDWPWASFYWKPSEEPIRNLEKMGALVAAEIDRLLALE